MTKPLKNKKKHEIYGCDLCHQRGYILQKQNKYSIARLCECYLCESCSNIGKIQYYDANGYSYLKQCDHCGVIHKNIKLYNLSCVPAKYYDKYEVGTFQPHRHDSHKKALKYVKDFVDLYPRKKGFILMGPAGLGKTHLSVAAISELALDKGVKCLFIEFFELLNQLKKSYTEGTPESNVIQPLIDAEVLVIDELGKGRANEWELGVLDQLISSRYNSLKTTLITTNYIDNATNISLNKDSREILEFRVGERISSRLYEMCEFIYMKGKDFRFEEYR